MKTKLGIFFSMVAVVLSTQAQGPPRVSDLLLPGENWQLVGEG